MSSTTRVYTAMYAYVGKCIHTAESLLPANVLETGRLQRRGKLQFPLFLGQDVPGLLEPSLMKSS